MLHCLAGLYFSAYSWVGSPTGLPNPFFPNMLAKSRPLENGLPILPSAHDLLVLKMNRLT